MRRQTPVRTPIAATDIIRSGMAGLFAPRAAIEALRTKLAREYAADHVALYSSGTHALTAALRQAHEEVGGAIALPAFACYDIATAAVASHASLVLYDVDDRTLEPDWSSLDAAARAGARVLVIAHLYGRPVDWDRAEDIAQRSGAILVEDAAQGLGGAWRGQPLGTLGRFSVLSFGRGKGWGGAGGGALLTRGTARRAEQPASPGIAAEMKSLVLVAAQWLLGRPGLYGIPHRLPWLRLGETVYHAPTPVTGITATAAAMARHGAPAAQREAAVRRANASVLRGAGLRGGAPVSLGDETTATSGDLRLPFLVEGERGPVVARLGRHGVEASYPTTLLALPVVRSRLGGPPVVLRGAETLARQLVTLPTHGRTTGRDRQAILAVLGDNPLRGVGSGSPSELLHSGSAQGYLGSAAAYPVRLHPEPQTAPSPGRHASGPDPVRARQLEPRSSSAEAATARHPIAPADPV